MNFVCVGGEPSTIQGSGGGSSISQRHFKTLTLKLGPETLKSVQPMDGYSRKSDLSECRGGQRMLL